MESFEEIVQLIRNSDRAIIAVTGIPGSGKSTFSQALSKSLNSETDSAAVIQFDGYHKYKENLTPDQLELRGRIDTFDFNKFKSDLLNFYEYRMYNNSIIKEFYFPSFDHSMKDPIENNIIIKSDTNYIIVEGLFVACKQLDCASLFDFNIFLDAKIEDSMDRVAKRNFHAGLSTTYENSVSRTNNNDRINALFVIENTVYNSKTIKFNYIP